jgi:hypothetical protein
MFLGYLDPDPEPFVSRILLLSFLSRSSWLIVATITDPHSKIKKTDPVPRAKRADPDSNTDKNLGVFKQKKSIVSLSYEITRYRTCLRERGELC